MIKVHSFKGFDQSACITDLESQPWDTIYLFDSPDDAWFGMETFLKDVCLKFAPLRTLWVCRSQRGWMSDQIRSMMKERDKMKRKVYVQIRSRLHQLQTVA